MPVTTTHVGHCLHLARALVAHARDRHTLHPDRSPASAHEIFQASTIAALLDGVYDGGVTYAQLEAHGDFGLGTFTALDGEMIAVDGSFFHLHADGSVTPVDPEERAPFAAVTWFRGDRHRACTGPLDRSGLESALDALAPSHNLFAAERVDGRFDRITTRTVGRQTRPYRPLTEATAEQEVRQWEDVAGTVAGFRSPNYAQGLSVAGYHFHFISDDRSRGGHVLDCTLAEGLLRADVESGLHLELPQTAAFMNADLEGHDLDREIGSSESDPA